MDGNGWFSAEHSRGLIQSWREVKAAVLLMLPRAPALQTTTADTLTVACWGVNRLLTSGLSVCTTSALLGT